MEPYTIAASNIIDEIEVTRSRFICYLSPCDSTIAFKQLLNDVQQLHPQANHHCYAFVAGHPQDSQCYGFSDDGEPSGTAGKPMLAVLQGSGIGEVAAIVVRYFGGTKLGTGGLQRAYSASVRSALSLLDVKTKIPKVYKSLACQYAQVDDILHLMKQAGADILTQDFTERVDLTLAIPEQGVELLAEQLKTMSCGQLTLNKINKK
ncbi:YigZ family protein [Thalassotalea sp. 1_MG-2023]|uniref:YigZ family protein n=1 Tax=Thalassotalea sp. 1_MG-2023 TaxID=3062680 RepID=UPI0026E40A0E|nr:YigZ family protein [Thalassotalea sp. 1_MG-2023]MDO6427630.1 YigZ family protein [Thalassotalea sp. 1_MG-2023]